MLLNEVQGAFNELIVEYREASDHFDDANLQLEDDALRELFSRIRKQHDSAAEQLSDVVKNSGALPRAQHADREQFHQMVTHVRAAFSQDERQVFLQDRLEHEQRIRAALEQTLLLGELSTENRQLIEHLLSVETGNITQLLGALAGKKTA